MDATADQGLRAALYRYGVCSYGLESHGLCSEGLFSYGLCSYGRGARTVDMTAAIKQKCLSYYAGR